MHHDTLSHDMSWTNNLWKKLSTVNNHYPKENNVNMAIYSQLALAGFLQSIVNISLYINALDLFLISLSKASNA